MKEAFTLCGASVIIYKENKILLQQRTDNHCWCHHGGKIELAERAEDAARRELLEETGLTANELTFFGVFSGSEMHHIYPDGNEVYIIEIVFLCSDFSGELLRQEAECLDLQWFDFDNLPENISPPALPALRQFFAQHGIDL